MLRLHAPVQVWLGFAASLLHVALLARAALAVAEAAALALDLPRALAGATLLAVRRGAVQRHVMTSRVVTWGRAARGAPPPQRNAML
jgi:hypothetical protein